MHKKWAILWIFTIFMLSCNGEVSENDVHSWRDPNDPTSGVRSKEKVQAVSVVQRKFQPDQSLRLILRQLLHELQIDYHHVGPAHRHLHLKISLHSMSVLSKYLENNSQFDDDAEKEAVRSALSNIFTVQPAIPDATWQDTFTTIQPFILTLNLIILPAATVIIVRSVCRPRNFWILFISTIIMVSMYSGYNKKYQEAEAKRFAQIQESSDACAPEGLVSRFVEILASPFQYRQKSKCLKFIESQTISIFHEISIIEVFSETISSGFFAFMSASAKHLNQFFRDLYDGAPILAQIVMTIFLVLMVGTIRTPFFSYEPIWLTFCSTSVGKIATWLEGQEEPRVVPVAIQLPRKEVQKLKNFSKKESEPAIEYPAPKSEPEDVKCEEIPEKKEEISNLAAESSEDEEDRDAVAETEWNEAVNSSSLSESSI